MSSREDFEIWWEKHGQFGRAGGGDYEKTFAFNAWTAAQSSAVRKCVEVVRGELIPLTAIKTAKDRETIIDYNDATTDCIKAIRLVFPEVFKGEAG